MKPGYAISVAAALAAAFVTMAVHAQPFSARPVRLLASGVGGGGDFTARLIATDLAPRIGQPVVVDNRPGGLVPGEILAKAPPDGHTLMLAGIVIWLSPFMRSSMPFDPVRDFAPVTLAVTVPNVLVVNPGLGVKSVADLVALAKRKPGELNYATSGTGNSNHIAGELFKAMAGVDLVRVNYRGAALAMNDLLSGRVQVMFATTAAAKAHVVSGKLTALAVTTPKPSALMPGLPTVAASGLPGYESASTLGVFAPAATPAAIVTRLNREIVRILDAPMTKEHLFKAGIEVVASSSAEFAAAIRKDMEHSGKVIRQAGIRTD